VSLEPSLIVRSGVDSILALLACLGPSLLPATVRADAGSLPAKTPAAPLAGAATAIDGGRVHTCAVVGGAVRCRGDNYHGRLGRGDAWRTRPERVIGLGPAGTRIYLPLDN